MRRHLIASLDKTASWDLMASYRIPRKIILLVRTMCQGMSCHILHEGGLTKKFRIKQESGWSSAITVPLDHLSPHRQGNERTNYD